MKYGNEYNDVVRHIEEYSGLKLKIFQKLMLYADILIHHKDVEKDILIWDGIESHIIIRK